MHNGQPHDPSRKGKGGPYGPKIPGGGTNPFRKDIKKAFHSNFKKNKKA